MAEFSLAGTGRVIVNQGRQLILLLAEHTQILQENEAKNVRLETEKLQSFVSAMVSGDQEELIP